MVNWREILKNQISVGRQKLRSSKRPLPEEEGNCEEEAREIINKFKELGKEMYTLLPYTEEVIPTKKGDIYLIMTMDYRKCSLRLRNPSAYGATDDMMLLQIVFEDRLKRQPEENTWCIWLQEFNDIKNKKEHITDKKFEMYDGHWIMRGTGLVSFKGSRVKQLFLWNSEENPFRIEVGTFIAPLENWPDDAKNLIGAEGMIEFTRLITKMEDLF